MEVHICGNNVRGGRGRNTLQYKAVDVGLRCRRLPVSAHLPVHRVDRVADEFADNESHDTDRRADSIADERAQRVAYRVADDRAQRVAHRGAHGGDRADGRADAGAFTQPDGHRALVHGRPQRELRRRVRELRRHVRRDRVLARLSARLDRHHRHG